MCLRKDNRDYNNLNYNLYYGQNVMNDYLIFIFLIFNFIFVFGFGNMNFENFSKELLGGFFFGWEI